MEVWLSRMSDLSIGRAEKGLREDAQGGAAQPGQDSMVEGVPMPRNTGWNQTWGLNPSLRSSGFTLNQNLS